MTGTLDARAARAAVIDSVRHVGPRWWLFAVAVTTLTDMVDFVALPAPGQRPGAGLVAALVVRVLLVFWAGYALPRRMADTPDPLRPGRAFGRFALFTILMLLAFGLVSRLIGAAAGLAARPLATQWLTLFLTGAAWGIVTIRLVGLTAAFANGATFRAAPPIVAGTRGHAAALAACYAQLILPFAAIHLAFTLLAVRLPFATGALAALALLDGVVSAVQMLTTTALAVAAWRIEGRRFP